MIATTRTAITVLAACTMVRAAPQLDVTSERNIGEFTSKVISLGEPVTILGLERIFRTNFDGASISTIDVFPSREIPDFVLTGKGATENDYDSWLERYQSIVREAEPDMGEIVKVDHDVLARTIRAGRYEEKVLSGRNPLLCDFGSPECRITWIRIGIVPPILEGKYRCPLVHLFVQDRSVPSIAEALKITGRLQRRFHTRLLTVSFRTDEWFVEDTEFPVVYPFRSRNPVDLEMIRKGPEVTCVSVDRPTKCGPILMR
jgi:hypothetical protein